MTSRSELLLRLVARLNQFRDACTITEEADYRENDELNRTVEQLGVTGTEARWSAEDRQAIADTAAWPFDDATRDRLAFVLWRRNRAFMEARKAAETWTWLPPGARRQYLEDARAILAEVLAP